MARRACLMAAVLLSLIVPASTGQHVLADDDGVRLTTPLRGHSASPLQGGAVLIAGGFDGVSESARVDLIDPGAGSAGQLGALLGARTDHTATRLDDGRILLAGGRADGLVLGTAELLDPTTGVSVGTEPMRQARFGHAAIPLPDGRVLLVGGSDEAGPVATAELFDPATGSFGNAAAPLAVPVDGAAVALPDGRVLLTGDTMAEQVVTNFFWRAAHHQASTREEALVSDVMGMLEEDEWVYADKVKDVILELAVESNRSR